MLLYTDGILDARDGSAQRFGEERLRSLVASYGRESATLRWSSTCGRRWPTTRPPAGDDVCLLAARNLAAVGSEAGG